MSGYPELDRARTLRGAVCGVVAATVWVVQQPLDKRLFASRYDDIELLGRALTRGRNWHAVGLATHLLNGAVFGGIYANIAPGLPIPARLRGPAVATVEHLAAWPLVALTDRWHPARSELPVLAGNRRALLQATWRHLLFGLVLGELERRLAGADQPEPPPEEAGFSSNGHGRIEHAVGVRAASGSAATDDDVV